MSGTRAFLDTNVLLYLLSGDVAKADRAESVVTAGGVVSVQVLNEFASVARRKLALAWPDIREVLTAVRAICPVVPLTLETHSRGLALAERYGFAVYDAMIAAAALDSGCDTLLTEDLQHGQSIEGSLTVRNPFLNLPDFAPKQGESEHGPGAA